MASELHVDAIKHSGGTSAMTIDSTGRILTPARPSFEAYRTSGNVSAGNIVVWNNTRHNIGGHYSTSTGKFTAPLAGVYLFTGQAFTNNANDIALDLQVNAVSRFRFQADDNAAYRSGTFAYTTLLSASDEVYMYTTTETAHFNTNGLYSHFAGVLIG